MERGQTNASFLAYCVPQDSGAEVQGSDGWSVVRLIRAFWLTACRRTVGLRCRGAMDGAWSD